MHYQRFFILNIVAGCLCLGLLLAIPSDPKNIWILGYSPLRLLQTIFIFSSVVVFFIFVINIQRKSLLGEKINTFLSGSVIKPVQSLGVTILIIGGILAPILFSIVWLTIFHEYSAVFLRLSPLMFFLFVVCTAGLFTLKNHCSQSYDSIRSSYKWLRRLNQEYFINWYCYFFLLLVGNVCTLFAVIYDLIH